MIREPVPLHNASPEAPVPDPGRKPCRKTIGAFQRKWVLIGLTIIILLFMGGMLAKCGPLDFPAGRIHFAAKSSDRGGKPRKDGSIACCC